MSKPKILALAVIMLLAGCELREPYEGDIHLIEKDGVKCMVLMAKRRGEFGSHSGISCDWAED